MLSNSIHKFLIAVVCVVAVCSSGFAQINVPQRFVQFRTLDFENGVVELHNLARPVNHLMAGVSVRMMRIKFASTVRLRV